MKPEQLEAACGFYYASTLKGKLKGKLNNIQSSSATLTDKESMVGKEYDNAWVNWCKGKRIATSIARFENCDAYWMTDRHNILVEYKYDIDMENPIERAKVIAQVVAYYKKIAEKGKVKCATVVFIADVNECFALHVNYLNKFVNLPGINWKVAPSNMGNDEVLVSAIAADTEISNKSVVFNTADPDFAEEKIFSTIRDLCNGVTRIVPITAGTMKMAYEYFSTKIVDIKKHKANDVVGMFYEFIKKGSECFVKNGKIYFQNYAPVAIDERKALQFLGRFGEFDANDKAELDRMYDTLVSDTERRINGQFFTPKVWVDEAHRRMARVLGEDWESKYPSWSCCCGTKSCSRDYEYGSLWLSTLEQSELNASSSLNTEAVDTFVFDFLNDSESKLPATLKEALKKAGKNGTPFTMLINPPYGQATSGNANAHKAGVSDTEIGREMKSIGLGKSANELTVQFLYRIMTIVKEYGIKDFTLGLFSKPKWFTGTSFEKFREEWLKVATYQNGFAFHSEEFEGVKEGWAINFSVWKLSA